MLLKAGISIEQEYGIKEVPDLFFMNTKMNWIECALLTVKNFRFVANKEGTYNISFEVGTISLGSYKFIITRPDLLKLYVRTTRRSRLDGKDSDCCMVFEDLELVKSKWELSSEGEPAQFYIELKADNWDWLVDSAKCPVAERQNGNVRVFFPDKDYFLKKEKQKLVAKCDKLQLQLNEIQNKIEE